MCVCIEKKLLQVNKQYFYISHQQREENTLKKCPFCQAMEKNVKRLAYFSHNGIFYGLRKTKKRKVNKQQQLMQVNKYGKKPKEGEIIAHKKSTKEINKM